MATGHPDWFKGIVLYGIGPEDEFIPIRTDEAGNLHVGYGTHAITHQDGGSDEISVNALEGVLHLEQKSSWALVSGKPGTFTPSAHKTSHQNGGADEISVAGLSGVLADEQPTSWGSITGKPGTFTPSAHKASHQDAGGDEINVAGLLGVLTNEQPSSWALVTGKPGTFTPSAHKTSHQNGGGDEISVAGLSGLLADAQTPLSHGNASHSPNMVEVDGSEPLTADWDAGAHKIRAQSLQADALPAGFIVYTGTAGLLCYNTGLSWDATNKRLGIGIAPATSALHVIGNIYAQADGYVSMLMDSHSSGASWHASQVQFRRSRNTMASPVIVANDDRLGVFEFRGWDGDQWVLAAQIDVRVGGAPGNNDMPGKINFNVTPDGGISPVTRLTVMADGTVDMSGKIWGRGNAGASLIHWTTTVSTSWQSANLSGVVGSRVAMVLIEIRNTTGSNHLYCFAPSASAGYYYSDMTWERGAAVAQVDNGKRSFIVVTTASNGLVYLRSSTNHSNTTDFYLVGFI